MANSIVNALFEERNNLWNNMRELNDREIEENRSLDSAEKEQWDKMNDRISEIDSRVQELVSLEEANKKSEEARAMFDSKPVVEKKAEDNNEASILRRMANGEIRSHNFEKRDMTKSADGGLVPQDFYSSIIAKLDENAVVRQFSTVVVTNNTNDIKMPQITALSSATLTAEAAALSESEPTSASVTLGAYKYGYLVEVSSELLSDEGVDIEAFLANDAGRALGNGAGAHFATGDGSSKPNGLVTASGAGVTTAGAAFTADEVIDLYHSVIAPYRNNGTWIMKDSTLKEIRQLKDSNNQYLWQPAMSLGNPDILLGRPVATDPNFASIATSAKVMTFGDVSKYFVREKSGISVDRSVDYKFANDLVVFRFLYHADGDLLDTNAVKHMVMGA